MPPRHYVTVGTRKPTPATDALALKRRIQTELIPALEAGHETGPLIEEIQSSFDVVLGVQHTAEWFVDDKGKMRGWGFNVFDADLDPPAP